MTVNGRVTIAQTRCSTPLTAIPTTRKGSRINQTIGYRNSAASARGQHSTNKMHQSRKVNILIQNTQPREKSSALLNGVGRVVGAADQGTAFDVPETHLVAQALQFGEFLNGHVTDDRQVLGGGT